MTFRSSSWFVVQEGFPQPGRAAESRLVFDLAQQRCVLRAQAGGGEEVGPARERGPQGFTPPPAPDALVVPAEIAQDRQDALGRQVSPEPPLEDGPTTSAF